ncbi:RNA polymerase sigma factor [Bizionia arctica]|uniref:DNA-directed RNA polymerase sigma-70 factor n=1 Tax=Bizionia arctica TaxID=1495645 RepID=A0A917GR69_9FLAO|nr:sigma-70 family RNA polymerase sigma factor [Bizionia arctica]GGG54942.1 DNA-directed RNA polymerase sigma-70 factor [Bizionia arctica]
MKQLKDKEFIFWTKLKDGNVDALGELYDMFINELFSYGMQLCNDKSYVMDCIHDLFLNLYKYRKNLATTDNVKYYLFRSLKNQILKKSNNKTSLFKENIHHNIYSSSIEDEIITSEISNERALRLSNAMNSLSKKQRKSLLLRFTEERSYEEIADIMEVSVQTSRTIIYRAIKVLRKNMAFLILSIFS